MSVDVRYCTFNVCVKHLSDFICAEHWTVVNIVLVLILCVLIICLV